MRDGRGVPPRTAPEAESPPSRARRYLPGLDGMRALAVIAVVLFHSPLAVATGGFLGVEVFFVISGYIITRALLTEREERGRIAIGRFWLRRARRLLPALFLLLAGVAAWSAFFAEGELAGLRRDMGAAFFYVTNWDLIITGENYFDSWERPSLLRHLWSLAVEEQFYLIWPLLLIGGLAILRKRLLLALILAGAALSAGVMAALHEPGGGVSRIYYATDTRASGLLIGAALAFVWSAPLAVARGRIRGAAEGAGLAMLGTAGLGALTGFVLLLDGDSTFLYRGGFALTGVATAALIVAATHGRSPFARLLGVQPLPWLGLRSYGIYLWHWPVMALTRPGVDVPLDGAALFALQATLTLALAEASYRWVETPVRTGALGRLRQRLRAGAPLWRRGAVALGGAAALAGAGALAFAVTVARAPEQPPYFALGSVRIQSAPAAAATPTQAPQPTPTSATVTAEVPPEPSPQPERLDDATDRVDAIATLGDASSRPMPAATPSEAAESPTPPPATDLDALIRAREPSAEGDANVSAQAEAPPAMAAAATVRVTAVGDSVMLGAAHQLAADVPGIDLDAAVGRQVKEVIALLREREANGLLGDVLLLHIGNNGKFTDEQFDRIVEVAGPQRRVVFLTVKVTREWEEANNAVIARGAERHPRAVVVDWRTAVLERPDVLWTDDTHLRPEGARLYATLLAPYLTAPAATEP